MQSLPIHRKWLLCLVVFLVALGVTTPALADYLGPNRTVTESVSACKIVLKECQFVPAKGDYRYKTSESWACSLESKPWQEYSSNSRPCNSGNTGYEYWEREDGSEDTIVTYPPATISGSLQNCSLQNGWCGVTTPQLTLSANEPVAGFNIVLIEGLLNGASFACPNATCSVSLNEGDNSLSYWALSSWGDSSTMDVFTARVDTISPDVGLDVSGANGANGWYVSPTIVTATGADATSGLASALLSVNGGAWQPSVTLNEGVYDIAVSAADVAGNVSNSSTLISVDTTTPSVNVSVSGTAGKNGWYRSNVQVSALASDLTSGISSLQVSADGGGYQNYRSAISFGDGSHTVQFRATDLAGNITETQIQLLYVDTVPPAISLPASWSLGKNVPYDVQDAGSGLAALRLVIEDEDERYAKVAWTETVSGSMYSEDIHWDGQFKDKTAAPPGTYLVWIKASDQAGNESIRLGRVIIPEPNVFLALVQADDALPEIPVETPAPPEELSDTNDSSSSTTSSDLDFGGSATEAIEATTHSLLLTTGTSGSIPSTSSGILWGAAAAAVAGSATAFVLAEKRKREDAIAEQEALEKAEEERRKKKKARKMEKMEAQHEQEKMWEAARQEAWHPAHMDLRIARSEEEEGVSNALKNLAPSLYRIIAKRDQRTDIKDALADQQINAYSAKPQEWKTNYDKYMAKKAFEDSVKKQEESSIQKDKPWWQKTWDGIKDTAEKGIQWVDEHQTELAIGVGVIAGATVIVLTGGLATPLVAAAFIVGSAVAAGASVSIATIALNVHYGRDWKENLGRNLLIAAGAAAVVSGAVLLFNTAVMAGTSYCITNPATCSQVAPTLRALDSINKIIDTGEAIWLSTKLAYQTWKGDEIGASQTAFDLHSEYVDGGIPGNTAVKELREQLADLNKGAIFLIRKHGVDVIPLLIKHGDEGLDIIRTYGDEGIAFLQKYGDDAFRLIHKLKPLVGEDTLKIVLKQGPSALAALSHWTDDEVLKYADELVARASTDAIALDATSKLAKIKDLQSPQAKELLKIIARNSIQGQGNRIILGKWIDGSFDEGFIGAARSRGTRYYGPNRGLETELRGLSAEEKEKCLWAINQAALQEAIDAGWEIDYSFDGLSERDTQTEIRAIDAIVSGNNKGVIDIFSRFPFRMKEIEFLVSQGYTPTIDEATQIVHWSRP